MPTPPIDKQAAPIGLQLKHGPQAASSAAARHRRSKLVYRAAVDAWMLGEHDEAQRLLDLWHQLQGRDAT